MDADALTTYCEANATPDTQAVCFVNNSVENDVKVGLNTFFLIFAAALVFMMQSGFAMLCAGSVRQKNVKNIMLKNLLDACGGALGFYFLGFGFSYGGDGDNPESTLIGDRYFALKGFTDYAGFFFQFAFAATAATIVAGTVAERCKMTAYLCYSVFLTAFVYPVVVHAVWDSHGFISAFASDPFMGVGMVDFAGSGVVHATGGATALVAAVVLGPRKGRFRDRDGNPLEEPHSFPAHSVALQILGTFILWFGWYGFNPGSALAIDNAGSAQTASLAAVTTTMAAASGCVVSMFTDSIFMACRQGHTSYDLTMAMNGALGGLVAITAGCPVVSPWTAIVIGAVGGWVYLFFSKLLVCCRVDDAVDAIPVHFANGVWGVVAVGLFAKRELLEIAGYASDHQGLFFSWREGSTDITLLIVQCLGIAFILAWVFAVMLPFFIILRVFGLFRVDPLEEEVGLDISHHRGAAYDLAGPDRDDVRELMEVRASRHGRDMIEYATSSKEQYNAAEAEEQSDDYSHTHVLNDGSDETSAGNNHNNRSSKKAAAAHDDTSDDEETQV